MSKLIVPKHIWDGKAVEKQKKELAKTFSFDEGMSKEVVDPSILGGVIVAFEGKRIDASFRSVLKRMAHQL